MKKTDPNVLIAPTEFERKCQQVAQLLYWLTNLCKRKALSQLRLDSEDMYCKKDYSEALVQRLRNISSTNTWDNLAREYVFQDGDDDEEHLDNIDAITYIETQIRYAEKRIWFTKILAWWEHYKLEALNVQLAKELVIERSKVKREDVLSKLTPQELEALGLDTKGNPLKGKK